MPRTLDFDFRGEISTCSIDRVDRRKLYGYVETEALDSSGRHCQLATLASDGRTVIPLGGIALATFSPDGRWLDKRELTAVDLHGDAITPVGSSFDNPIELRDTATVEDYLDHNIRMAYALGTEGGIAPALLAELSRGTVFAFEFSYRGGLVPDSAFLLQGAGGTLWMTVGSPTTIEFLSYEQVGFAVDPDDGDEDDDGSSGLDFSMI